MDVSQQVDEDFIAFLMGKIRKFNMQHSPHHKAASRKGAVLPINIAVADDNDQWIGGISSEVYWDWLEINYFWLRDDLRGQGIGSHLLNQTEKIAGEKGARRALVTTFKFQARSFYEAKGYHVVGEVKDYPPGSSYYTMVKQF